MMPRVRNVASVLTAEIGLLCYQGAAPRLTRTSLALP